MPFAWSQLVFYHRGPDYPLGAAVRTDQQIKPALRRTFLDAGDRRILVTGFIGRRTDMHRVRRKIREGQRVFVFQGLGGLGKSTLALEVLKLLGGREDACVFWCQDTEDEPNQAEALVGQLLSYCRRRFGLDWEAVVQRVDRMAGDDPVRRFAFYLLSLTKNSERIVLYLDNLESLLVGPGDDRAADQFAEWRDPTLGAIWQAAKDLAENGQGLCVVASCRYRHEDFRSALIPVSPLPADALLRLTEWFPALGWLTWHNRARLAALLDGHPRAVEYANDLVRNAIDGYRERVGQWSVSSPPTRQDVDREWCELVEPALPRVRDRLEADLLLAQLWERVLDEPARRMLFRMSLLRGSWGWELVQVLGDPDQADAEAVAQRLRGTSLLEQVELLTQAEGGPRLVTRHTLHPATVEFIRRRFAGEEIAQDAHRRIGEFLEGQVAKSPYIETGLEAGHHLFQAGLYDRAYELLGSASDWLRNHGRVREGLRVLEPFLAVQSQMQPVLVGRLLGTVGLAYQTWARCGRRSGTTSRRWRLTVRSATDAGRATPWATWAWPTQTWARCGRRSGTTSRRW